MNRLHSFLSRDIAVDLGTANTLIYIKGKGVVLSEPSVVTVQVGSKKILAVGSEAKRMLGRTPSNVVAIRPLKDGVIADLGFTEKMLRYFLKKIYGLSSLYRSRPRVVIGIPSGITEVEKLALEDAVLRAGAREVLLIEQAMAAAIGAGLPVTEPVGNMIVDIGGGTTDVAVIALSGIVSSQSIRVAGDEFDEVIATYLRKRYNLIIGDWTAEEIKMQIGSAYRLDGTVTMEVRGRDQGEGLPKTMIINADEIRDTMIETAAYIIDVIRTTLEVCPPELSADLVERGIVLSGGGALLKGLDKLITESTHLPVKIADAPFSSVVTGTGLALDNASILKQITLSGRRELGRRKVYRR